MPDLLTRLQAALADRYRLQRERPVIGHRQLVEEAKTAMIRLTGRRD